jgi:hypothetical protein
VSLQFTVLLPRGKVSVTDNFIWEHATITLVRHTGRPLSEISPAAGDTRHWVAHSLPSTLEPFADKNPVTSARYTLCLKLNNYWNGQGYLRFSVSRFSSTYSQNRSLHSVLKTFTHLFQLHDLPSFSYSTSKSNSLSQSSSSVHFSNLLCSLHVPPIFST